MKAFHDHGWLFTTRGMSICSNQAANERVARDETSKGLSEKSAT